MLSTIITIATTIVIILYTMSTIASLYYSIIFCPALVFLKVITLPRFRKIQVVVNSVLSDNKKRTKHYTSE